MAEFEKTVTDTYGDETVVSAVGPYVYLEVFQETPEGFATSEFHPETARKLAKALKRAAKVAEGNG